MTYYLQVTISFKSLQLTLASKDIVNASFSSNSTDSNLSLSPGICEQSASITFYDPDKQVEGLFASGTNTTSSISFNVYDSSGNVVDTRYFTSSQYSFDDDKGTCTIECTDSIDFLNNILLERLPPQSTTFTLNDLITQTLNKNLLPAGKKWSYQDSDTREWCKNITLAKAWYDAQSLYDLLIKICNVGMLRIYTISNNLYIMRCFYE